MKLISNNALEFITKSKQPVVKICAPLYEGFGITYLSFTRHYPNGDMLTLTTHPEWKKYFWEQSFHKKSWFKKKSFTEHKNSYKIWDDKRNRASKFNEYNIIAQEARNKFHLHHGLTICIKHTKYCELCSFAAGEENSELNTHFESHDQFFKEFIFYFKEHAKELITQGEQHKINLFKETPIATNTNIRLNPPKLKIKKYYFTGLAGECYLTPKEIKCLQLSYVGKSADQIAEHMHVSIFTVQTHHKKIKNKMGVKKITDAIRIVNEQTSILQPCL